MALRQLRRPLFHLIGAGSFLAKALLAQTGTGGATLPSPPGGDDVNWGQVAEDYETRFTSPTTAIPVAQLALPWEPVKAVVLVIPLKEWQSDPALARIVRELLAALLPQGPVIGLYHENDYRLLADWLIAMEAHPTIGPHLNRVELVPSEPFSLWVRDFVPLFGRSQSGRLLAIDPSFLPSRRMMNNLQNAKVEIDPLQQYLNLRDANVELKGRRGSDLVGSALISFVEARWQVPTALSRPPIYLLGGDCLLVDAKTALVSAETLAENGGRSEAFARTLREYFGIERVFTMENLPGDSIEHLDFVIQPMGSDVILVASPPDSFGTTRSYHRYLDRELKSRLRRNRDRLERLFPDHRLVEVPMLPPLLDDENRVIDDLLVHCIQQIAAEQGLPFWPDGQGGDPLDERAIDDRLKRAIAIETGLRNWNSAIERRSAVTAFLNQPLEPLIARHVEEHVRYRSYVNSLLVRSPDGRARVLVPRFRPQGRDEEALVKRLEAETAAAYGEALPHAELIWIDCTELTGYLGAVHCLTATIPDPAALGITAPAK